MEVYHIYQEINNKESEFVKPINIVLFILFLLAEIWCIISTRKAIKVKGVFSGIPIFLLYLCMHWMLILRAFYCLGLVTFDNKRKTMEYLEDIALLGKDTFVLVLGWKSIEIMYSLDDSMQYLTKLIKVLIVMAIAHAVLFIALYIVNLSIQKNYITMYFCGSETLFLMIYAYICITTIRFWRSRGIGNKLTGYLKLLFVTMLYMILTLLARITINIASIASAYFDINKVMTYCQAAVHFVVEFVPCVLMSLCLYMMAVEAEGYDDPLTDSVIDGY